MQFIAHDGILFRPKAILGKQWMLDHPVPPSDKRPLLAWQPIFAFVADSGELGYTTGPWESKDDINDPKPSGYGEFITVWKKQVDGTWKFAVDLGISHPQSAGPLRIWQVRDGAPARKGSAVDRTAAQQSLFQRDTEFSNMSSRQGILPAFTTFAASDIRLFREGSFPFVGKGPALRGLTNKKELVDSQASGNGVSNSGDLGYVYGSYETRSADAERKVTGQGNFLRIWRKRGGLWQIVLDVASPIQQ